MTASTAGSMEIPSGGLAVTDVQGGISPDVQHIQQPTADRMKVTGAGLAVTDALRETALVNRPATGLMGITSGWRTGTGGLQGAALIHRPPVVGTVGTGSDGGTQTDLLQGATRASRLAAGAVGTHSCVPAGTDVPGGTTPEPRHQQDSVSTRLSPVTLSSTRRYVCYMRSSEQPITLKM